MAPALEGFESLLSGPTPAVLSTYRKDGTVKLSPVWVRYEDEHFEVVIADGDIKLKHIRRNPNVTLVMFETSPPFRGLQVADEAVVTREGLNEVRRSITSRYLDNESSRRFTERRRDNGAVIRIPSLTLKTWGLSSITS